MRAVTLGVLCALCGFRTVRTAWGAEGAGAAGEVAVAETVKRPRWTWDPTGRRDPFVFEAPRPVKPPGPRPGEGRKTGRESGSIVPVPPPPTEKDPVRARLAVNKAAEEIAKVAFEALGWREYVKADEYVGSALAQMEMVGLDRPRLKERLTRLKKTAERLDRRAKIEKEFRELKIVIQGIVWEPIRPVALINEGIVQEGDTVLGARVVDIRPGEVIFSLKGVKVSKAVVQAFPGAGD